MAQWDYDPIIFKKRSGLPGDEFVEYSNVPHLIKNCKTTLQELPDIGHHVHIENLFETLSTSPESGKFHVDYLTGVVTFCEDINNTIVNISYFGTGIVFVAASRVYLDVSVDGTIQTLADFIERSKLVVNRVREIYTTQVNATNGTDVQTFYAQAGYVAKLKYIGINIPAIATSTGNHKIEVTLGTDVVFEEEKLFTRTEAGINEISIKSEIDSGIYDIVFDENTPLQVKYTNNSNKNQTGTRFIYLIYEEQSKI